MENEVQKNGFIAVAGPERQQQHLLALLSSSSPLRRFCSGVGPGARGAPVPGSAQPTTSTEQRSQTGQAAAPVAYWSPEDAGPGGRRVDW